MKYDDSYEPNTSFSLVQGQGLILWLSQTRPGEVNWSDNVRKWSKNKNGLWLQCLFISRPKCHWMDYDNSYEPNTSFSLVQGQGLILWMSQTRPGEVNWSDNDRKWLQYWLDCDDMINSFQAQKVTLWIMLILMSQTPLFH